MSTLDTGPYISRTGYWKIQNADMKDRIEFIIYDGAVYLYNT